MRPTDLKFRNPKERTPDPYDALVTSNGTALFHYRRKPKTSFSQAKRFYEPLADKLGFWRGPGSYDLSLNTISKRKVRGGPVYRALHGNKDLTTNAYYYIGNNLVYDPSILLGNKNKSLAECGIEQCVSSKTRPTTASSRNYSAGVRRFMTPQPGEGTGRPGSAQKTR
jgi:hypothetical protein